MSKLSLRTKVSEVGVGSFVCAKLKKSGGLKFGSKVPALLEVWVGLILAVRNKREKSQDLIKRSSNDTKVCNTFLRMLRRCPQKFPFKRSRPDNPI